MLDMTDAMKFSPAPGKESVFINTWANGSCIPPQLVGRVEPGVWIGFINAISTLYMTRPSCLAYVKCLLCCTCEPLRIDLDSTLAQIEAAYAQQLGAVRFSKLKYTYMYWAPFTPATPSSENGPGSPAVPPHWEERELTYLRIDFATPFTVCPAPAGGPRCSRRGW